MRRGREGAPGHARASAGRLAQPDPIVPGVVSRHDLLGSDEYRPRPPGIAGGGQQSKNPVEPIIFGDSGPVAAGTKSVAAPFATGSPGSPSDPPKTHSFVHRLGLLGFFLACCGLAWLLWIGLNLVTRGNGEMLGQSYPPPLMFKADLRALRLRVFDHKIEVPLPEKALRQSGARIAVSARAVRTKVLVPSLDKLARWSVTSIVPSVKTPTREKVIPKVKVVPAPPPDRPSYGGRVGAVCR